MSFSIVLYNNTDELNRIKKTHLASGVSISGNLREESSVVDPVITVEYAGTLVNYNYMYIPEFHRYYFITNVESVATKLWRIHAHCDVLMSFSDGILACTGVIARQENEYNLYLSDSAFKAYSNPRLQVRNFPNSFTGESYVLVMKGAQFATNS